MYHFFDTEIAKTCGICEAVLFDRIGAMVFACQACGENYYCGKFWLPKTISEFASEFPYMSYRTIQRCLRHLEAEHLIETNKFSGRVNLYTLTEKGKRLYDLDGCIGLR